MDYNSYYGYPNSYRDMRIQNVVWNPTPTVPNNQNWIPASHFQSTPTYSTSFQFRIPDQPPASPKRAFPSRSSTSSQSPHKPPLLPLLDLHEIENVINSPHKPHGPTNHTSNYHFLQTAKFTPVNDDVESSTSMTEVMRIHISELSKVLSTTTNFRFRFRTNSVVSYNNVVRIPNDDRDPKSEGNFLMFDFTEMTQNDLQGRLLEERLYCKGKNSCQRGKGNCPVRLMWRLYSSDVESWFIRLYYTGDHGPLYNPNEIPPRYLELVKEPPQIIPDKNFTYCSDYPKAVSTLYHHV